MIDAREIYERSGARRDFTTWFNSMAQKLNLKYEFSRVKTEKGKHCKSRGRLKNVYMLNKENAEKLQEATVKKIPYCAFEAAALTTIEQVLNIKLERQYRVGPYRIDGYHKETNTAYEIDEEQHFINGELSKKCIERQRFIEEELGCSFVRIKL